MLDDAARLLLPSDPSITATVVDGRRTTDADAEVVVWYWTPTSSGDPVTGLGRGGRRELELFRLRFGRARGLRIVRAHRLRPTQLPTGVVRRWARGAVFGGAIVELSRFGPYERVVDTAALAAGSPAPAAGISFGSGGSALAAVSIGGKNAVLRVGLIGAPGDPARAAAGLSFVSGAQIPQIPRLLASGTGSGASWTAEVALLGSPPRRVERPVIDDVVGILGRLPSVSASPTSLVEDLSVIAAGVPARAVRVAQLLDRVRGDLAALPAVTRHGDLWSGNLLVNDGRVAGVVDWDAWHPASVPGTDLLQLLVTDWRRRVACPLGEAWVRRPWDDARVTVELRRHLQHVGVDPRQDVVALIALAWWATEVAGTLRRAPTLGTDPNWLAGNVDQVLAT